jgi:hypothetical protein
MAIILALSWCGDADAYVVAKYRQPPVTFWIRDDADAGHWETTGERFWLVDWRYANNLAWDYTRIAVIEPCSAQRWAGEYAPVVDPATWAWPDEDE